MRFCESGPAIPDHLLWERDAGNVVFICGAGVSAQEAKLPDFENLAKEVMKCLGVSGHSDARKLLDATMKQDSFVPVDKIFGILEREYLLPDIERAIRKVLFRSNSVNLTCHEIIRDLATTKDEQVRIVTTNFDDLLSRVTKCPEWVYPDLPTMENEGDFSGLAYLHGKFRKLKSTRKDELVISTRSFGRAYLAGGRASMFLKSILENYTVVFIGYSADDPPVEYLLEALAQSENSGKTAYAFQSGNQNDADNKWGHRGVKAICFDDYGHLWDTLSHWRHRANNFDEWANKVLEMAQHGPDRLTQWQRSQVMHLAMHPTGAEAISKYKDPIPPQWLFTFDSKFRYATPTKKIEVDDEQEHYDPFDHFGLEEDGIPPVVSPDDYTEERTPPKDSRDVFRLSQYDEVGTLKEKFFDKICLAFYNDNFELSQRLWHISDWIIRISNNPITIRWAAHQAGLNESLRDGIRLQIRTQGEFYSSDVSRAWEEIFEFWKRKQSESWHDIHTLQDYSDWTHGRVLQYQEILEPRLKIELDRPWTECQGIKSNPTGIDDIIKFGVNYVNPYMEISNTRGWEREIMTADRNNLDRAIFLENRTSRTNYRYQMPILDVDSENIYSLSDDIRSLIIRYCRSFASFAAVDRNGSIAELDTWHQKDAYIYGHILVWALGSISELPKAKYTSALLNISDEVFWGASHREGLLKALKCKWNSLSSTDVMKIEDRIVKGCNVDYRDSESDWEERKAHMSLSMLQWLHDNKCNLQLNYSSTVRRLKRRCTSLTPIDSQKFEKPIEIVGGMVSKNNDWTVLKNVPVSKIVDVALKNSGYDSKAPVFYDPFRGLCMDRPGLAFAALKSSGRKGVYPNLVWKGWLEMEWKSKKYRRYLGRTSDLFSGAKDDELVDIYDDFCHWFKDVADQYQDQEVDLRDHLYFRLIEILQRHDGTGRSSIIRMENREIDWVFEAINSPAGHIANGLRKFSEFCASSRMKEIPKSWLDKANLLLSLKGDNSRFALIELTVELMRLRHLAPSWTNEHIIIAAGSEDRDTKQAFWSGIAAWKTVDSCELFLDIKKPFLEWLTCSDFNSMKNQDVLVSILFRAWINSDDVRELISHDEFRTLLQLVSEPFRIGILDLLLGWGRSEKYEPSIDQYHKIKEFLLHIWPMDRSAVSAESNFKILQILFSYPSLLPNYSAVLIPRLREVGASCKDYFDSDTIDANVNVISREHPKILLDLIEVLSPDQVNIFGSNIAGVIDAIEKTHPKMSTYRRLKRLRTILKI